MKKLILYTLILLLMSCRSTQEVDTSVYMDAKQPVDKRVEALLAQMTLEEKVGQMDMVTVWDKEAIFKNGYYDFGAWLADLEPEECNQLQKLSEQTRLKIPYLIGMDAAHGYAMLTGRTIFPTSISMAATFNRELIYRTTSKAGEEIRSSGIHWAFAPCIDIVQDARWGRTGETYGEDPFLTSELVKEAIRGYQGNENPFKKVAVSVKHLVGGGASVGGCNHASAELSERALRSYFLPPFKAAIEAGCMTIMPGHNDIAGVPVHASKWLLTDIIKQEYGFKGFFISDMGDVENLATSLHQIAENQKEAVCKSVNAGLDMHMYSADSARFVSPLVELVREKKVSSRRIDDAVRRILKIKFELGLFEKRYVSPEEDSYGSKENKALALEAAREAIVLLKNDRQILPLDRTKYKKILVTGPNADNQSILGDWSIFQPDDHVTTILEGIQAAASPEQSILYSNSGRIKAKKSDLSVNTTDPAIQKKLITEGGGISDYSIDDAVRKARQSDLAIVAIGGYGIRSEWGLRTYGESADRPSIDFYGRQLELVQAIHATGTPVVIVIVNGKPLNNEWITKNIPTIVDVWEPGMYGGQALAEILFGEVNPSGKLPFTFPVRLEDNPAIALDAYPGDGKQVEYKEGIFVGYRWNDRERIKPLFCFGHGLSYTTFEYGKVTAEGRQMGPDGTITVSVPVKNTGSRAGAEIVQLYVSDLKSSLPRPVKELKGFRKITLQPGQEQMVSFTIDRKALSFYDDTKQDWVAEPGTFEVLVGASACDIRGKAAFELTAR